MGRNASTASGTPAHACPRALAAVLICLSWLHAQPLRAGAVQALDTYFVHTATVGNIDGPATFLNHPTLSGQPDAIVLATQRRSLDGGTGVLNPTEIGVFYDPADGGRWAVYNEDGSAMPPGAAFNVFLPAGDNAQVHVATDPNSMLNWTNLEDPAANDNPAAKVFAIHNRSPGGIDTAPHDHVIGLWFSSQERWAVFNQDIVDMVAGTAFNAFVALTDPDVFTHTATADDSEAEITWIDHPTINGDARAWILAAQNWSAASVYNNHPIGVSYSPQRRRWAVFNQDDAAIPLSASFNLLVFGSGLFADGFEDP